MILHHPKLLEKWGIAEMNSHLTGDFLGWVGILIPNLTFNWDSNRNPPLLPWSYLAYYVTTLMNHLFTYWYPTEINKNIDLTSPNQLTIKSSFCSSHSVYRSLSWSLKNITCTVHAQPLIAAWWRMRPWCELLGCFIFRKGHTLNIQWVKHVMQTKRRLLGQILNIVWRCMYQQIQAIKMSDFDEYCWCAKYLQVSPSRFCILPINSCRKLNSYSQFLLEGIFVVSA